MTVMELPKRFSLDVDQGIRDSLAQILGREEIVLASGSPRRREILQRAGVACRVLVPDVDESVPPDAEPREFAISLALKKLESLPATGALTVAADTIVVLDNQILGKPVDVADARRILRILSGQRHFVLTALAIRDRTGRIVGDADETFVTFHPLADREIEAYVASGEPMDKAGAYGIQGMGELLVAGLEGSLHNVIGFPIELFVHMLMELRS
jgi:septum formation protein